MVTTTFLEMQLRQSSYGVNLRWVCLLKIGHCVFSVGQSRPLFAYFCSFQTQILGTEKTEALSEVRTWIVGVECNLADRHHGPKSDIWVIPKFEFNFD